MATRFLELQELLRRWLLCLLFVHSEVQLLEMLMDWPAVLVLRVEHQQLEVYLKEKQKTLWTLAWFFRQISEFF